MLGKCKKCDTNVGIVNLKDGVCKSCLDKTEISSKDEKCPKCGSPSESPSNISLVITVLLVGTIAGFFFGGGFEKKFADDSLIQLAADNSQELADLYNIPAERGDRMEACAQAHIVSVAYLRASDSFNFSHWQATTRRACAPFRK